MLLDDTKHTVYIHDLDRELEEIESQEASVPFLSRIAEKLAPIPSSILPPRPQGNELVLYREPTSLTVPKNQDSVRKAVMESRERARKAQNGNQDSNPDPWPRWSEARRTSGMNGEATEEADDDRMDVDGL